MPDLRDRPREIAIQIARNASDLMPYRSAWEHLAGRALEPNVFYEPGPMLAALWHSSLPADLTAALIFARGAAPQADRLVGFFPFMKVNRGPWGLVASYRLWKGPRCYLCTPLVDQQHAADAIDAILDWMDGLPDGIRFFGLCEIGVDGPFARILIDRLSQRRLPHHLGWRYQRAMLRPGENARTYIASAVSAKRRKEYRRLRNRLADLGKIETVTCGQSDPIHPWVDVFLALEKRGWKGAVGTALGSTPSDEHFFRRLMADAHARGQVRMLALLLDKTPIAMKWDLFAAPGNGYGFAFRIAYDERFARYSPGVLLELRAIEMIHDLSARPRWVDSCALPRHTMIEALWSERREIGSIWCASSGIAARCLFKAAILKHRISPVQVAIHRGPRAYGRSSADGEPR